jgi:hypothetical protein
VREYLGSIKSDSNINFGIKNTAEKEPEDFWVFNNGLTVLVNKYTVTEKFGKKNLTIAGMSIVNGAQTTGAIGSLKKIPQEKLYIPVRFVQTQSPDLVLSIVQYNNSQNKITASDFRSTDKIQRKLKEQFVKIPNAEYTGGRRGSYGDVIVRRPNLLPSYTVGQALAAFHGDPIVAYNQKTDIWVSDKLYSKYFSDDTTAAHIVFAYGLLRAVETKKMYLVNKAKGAEDNLTDAEQQQLGFLRKRGSIYLLVSAISSCLEIFRGGRLPNTFRLSFGDRTSPEESMKTWSAIVEIAASFCNQLDGAISDGLKNLEKVNAAITTFRSLVLATAAANSVIYKRFASHTKTV